MLGLRTVETDRVTSEQRQPVPYPAVKWVTDKTVAVLLMLFLSPIFVLAVSATALDMLLVARDRGSWLYRERRISCGCEFDLLKFRVLREDVLAEMRRRGGHARLEEADPRNLTWAGRHLLKRWYLDELPQLVHVVRGQMSLVGPRPWPVSMVNEQVAEGLDYRNLIRAGLTGPAQVSKGVPDPVSYTRLDLAYVEACRTQNSSQLLRHDLAILYQTLRVILRGQGLNY
jgi:lipopolysaccharide/colanic/teichoic acid biosynthesis glycosyltransferase